MIDEVDTPSVQGPINVLKVDELAAFDEEENENLNVVDQRAHSCVE